MLSMACGIGIQSMAEKFAPKLVVPAVNTNMLGMPQEHAVWLERCGACGDCVHRRDRRHLPRRALQQEPHERPLRRLARRQVRGHDAREGRHRLRLAPHLGAPQGAGSRRADVSSTGRRRTGARAAPAARGRWCVRRRSRYDRHRVQGWHQPREDPQRGQVRGHRRVRPAQERRRQRHRGEGQDPQGLRRRRQHHRQPDRRGARLLHGVRRTRRSRTASRRSCR